MQTIGNRPLDAHDDYQPMLDAVTKTFASVKRNPLFTTDAEDLWKTWLSYLPDDEQQHHNCHACRRFVERYGGLVTISDDGDISPATIDDAPGIYSNAFRAVAARVSKARVTGVFVSSERSWGLAENPDKKRDRTWRHMHVTPPPEVLHRGAILNADQRAAELHEEYAMLCRALAEIRGDVLTAALSIAESEALYRSEKVQGRIRWLVDLRNKRETTPNTRWRENITWLAVATAPAGFCHVRASVVGSLLEDIEAGKSFTEVKRAFDAKMHPLQYQRPSAAPSAGNIKQAEEIVAKLGSAGSLRRRFARVEELKTIWLPTAKTPADPSRPILAKGAVFAHLVTDAERSGADLLVAKSPAMTWEKFARTVLGTAEELAVWVPKGASHFTAFVTAADPDAPPIIQWDREDARNAFSWYTYFGGSMPLQWNLTPGWVPVTAVSPMPNQWQEGFDHHGKGIMLVLEGCHDTADASACLFPELLKSDYHAVRQTIERFSHGAKLEGADRASACGLTVRAGTPANAAIRAKSRGAYTEYTIDRWD